MADDASPKVVWAYKLSCWTCKKPLHDANDPEDRKRAISELSAGTLVCGGCKKQYTVIDKGKNQYMIQPKK